MKNLLNRFVVKRRNIIIEESDITNVVAVLDRHVSIGHKEMSIGNCGWADTTKWFVHFNASNDEWNLIVHELKNGNFKSVSTYKKGYYYI